MSLLVAIKEILKNPRKASINIIVVTLFFSIVISTINIAPQLSSQLKELSSYGVTANVYAEVDKVIEADFSNYSFSTKSMGILKDDNLVNVDGIFTEDRKYTIYGDGYIYLTKMAADNLGVNSGYYDDISFNINGVDYEEGYDIIVLPLVTTYEECYMTINDYEMFDIEEAFIDIKISEYGDLEKAYNLLSSEEAYESSDVETFFSYYKIVKVIETLLYLLAFICLIIASFILFNLMDIFVSKRERFIGILKNEGASNTFIFNIYAVLIEVTAIISLFLSVIISGLINKFITNQSVKLLPNSINISYKWYIPVLVFIAFNFIFVVFFTILRRSISKTDTALVIRRL